MPLFAPDTPWLAPLAGYSDLPFRLLCREHGAAVCCTEMLSAKGLAYGGNNTRNLVLTCPEDQPLVAQLFGAEPDFMAQGVHLLQERGFTCFDVNMGCSVPKVNKTGAGSALLKNPALALEVGQAVIAAAGPHQVGFKLRLGWDNDLVYLNLAKALADAGAAWISLHPRTAKQGFSGSIQRQALSTLVQALEPWRIPVIASGDLFSAQQGVDCIRECGVSTVMYARGAMNEPNIFAQHKALWHGQTIDNAYSPSKLLAIIQRHATLARTYAPQSALLKMRTFVPRYVRHLPGVRVLRQQLMTCRDWDSLEAVLALGLERLEHFDSSEQAQPAEFSEFESQATPSGGRKESAHE